MARSKRKSVTITIELTPDEVTYINTCCIGRVASSALKAVPEDYEHWEDLQELIDIVEPLRIRLNDAIFKVCIAEEKARLDQVEVTHHTGGSNGEE